MKLSEVFKAIEDGKKLQVKFKSKKTFDDFDILVLRDLTFKELEECQFQYAPIIINGHSLCPERKELEEDDYYYIPSFSDPDCLYEEFSWESDSDLCQFHLKNNLVYLQPCNAEKHAKALLNIKE